MRGCVHMRGGGACIDEATNMCAWCLGRFGVGFVNGCDGDEVTPGRLDWMTGARARSVGAVARCLVGAGFFAGFFTFLMPVQALGAEVQIDAQTQAQAYQVRNRWGAPVLSRRRVMQTLGLDVTRIGQGDAHEHDEGMGDDVQVTFRARMRFDTDFGIESGEFESAGDARAFVPGLTRAPFDLMYGYFDVSNVASGLMSARLGRQYVIDSLGWWSFDGVLVRLDLPIYLGIEGYTGWEQRGGLPLSGSAFERDGVWRGDRLGMEGELYPEYLQSSMAPAQGVALETVGIPVFHGRFAYRRVWNTGTVATRALVGQERVSTYEGWRMSQERMGVSADVTVDDVGSVRGAVTYDLMRAMVTSWNVSTDVYATSRVVLGVDADREVPVFDGDSIWNWFAADPMSTVAARGDWVISKRLRGALSAGIRWVDVPVQLADGVGKVGVNGADDGGGAGENAKENEEKKAPFVDQVDGIGRVSLRYDLDAGQVGMGAMTDRGMRGVRDGVDVFGDYEIEERYGLSARASLYDWRGGESSGQVGEKAGAAGYGRATTSFGYVLGGGYRIDDQMMVRLEWEHDINEKVGQRYRILASLQLAVMP